VIEVFGIPSVNQLSACTCTAQIEVHSVVILNSWNDRRYEFQKYEKVPIQKRSHRLDAGKREG
jgi:hypothetical protein